MSRLVERYIDFVLAWRVWVLICVVLVSLGLSSGAAHLSMASDYRVFFGPDNPDLKR